MSWPWYQSRVEIHSNLDSYDANGGKSFSLVAPEKPGIYTLPVALNFNYKTGGRRAGSGYYIGQHRIQVCGNDHDVDFIMPGVQRVDGTGEIQGTGITSPGIISTGYMVQKYKSDLGVSIIDS